VGFGGAVVAASPPANLSLSGDANASPLEVQMVAGTVAKDPLVDARYAHAQADVASGDQETAHGSILDPGALVQTLPYEFAANCPPPSPFPQQPPPGGCPQFPRWPFGADADAAHPEATGSVGGSSVGPLSFGAGEYNLSVAAGRALASTTGGRVAVASLTVASGSSQSSVTAQGSTVVSQVTERLHGVVIDGVLDIAAIESTVTVRTGAGSPGASSGRLTVSGVTVAGQAASIDGSGIHIVGRSQALPIGPAEEALQQLERAGIAVRMLEPQQAAHAGYGSYDGAALQVTLASPQDGSGFTVLLGPAAASAVAVPFQSLALPSFGFDGSASGVGLTSSTLPNATAPTASTPPGSSGTAVRLLGVALTPKALLLALLGVVELSLIAFATLLLWPVRAAAPAPTLRAL
jgi:hypothetical protein